ncbi:Arc family DNA-binding protein [Salipiger abyssi]|uniref:Arc family DNA-binding protein n=1 Tax=Salipiger abyssi TaxID=1250539 RepID=UPI000978C7EE|nr:Arc family DNA-binding protein [Salipiger abyssi]
MSDNDQHQFKDRYMLRLPDGMRDRIKLAAEANGRSMNSEIVAVLEEKFPAPITADDDLMLACAAAVTFSPSRVGARLKDDYFNLMRYIRDVHGVQDPISLVNGIQRDSSQLTGITIGTMYEWLHSVFDPWVVENPPDDP